MAVKNLMGGKNYVQFFRVKENAGGTAYEIRKADGLTVATLPTDATFIAAGFASGDFKNQEDGTIQITWENFEDSRAFQTFLNLTATPSAAATSTLPTINYQDGTKMYESGTTGEMLLMIAYEAQDTSGTKDLKLCAAYGGLKPTSGSWKSTYNAWNQPTMEFVSSKTKFALPIAKTLLATALVDTTTDPSLSIAANTGRLITFVTGK